MLTLFFKKKLDLVKRYTRIAIKPTIALSLGLVLKLNKRYRQIYNLFFLLVFLVNNVILEEYKVLVYIIVTAI